MSLTWFITGASRGLGRTIAETALQSGDQVVATARRVSDLDDLVSRYAERICAIPLDVTEENQIDLAVAQALARFERIDVVVNNAGYGGVQAAEYVSLTELRQMFDTNFFGAVAVTKAFIPVFRRQGGGRIIQVSSVSGRIIFPGMASYHASKHALGAWSESVAAELAPLNIHVTIVEPGGMRTSMATVTQVDGEAPGYEDTVGVAARMVQKSVGHETIDPAKVAAVFMTVATIAVPPTHLVLGRDSVDQVASHATALSAADANWVQMSRSVDFDKS